MEKIELARRIVIIAGFIGMILMLSYGLFELGGTSEAFEAAKAAGAIPEVLERHYEGLYYLLMGAMVMLILVGLIKKPEKTE